MKLALQKKTKIVATISDKRCDVAFLQQLYETGMNVVRINTAHQTPETSLGIIENVRKISTKIGILIDTKGPEIRITEMKNDQAVAVVTGDRVKMSGNPEVASGPEMLCTNYEDFVKEVPVGAFILIDDGDVQLQVVEKHDDYLLCEAKNDGKLKGRKTVNVPNVHMNLPPLTRRDVRFIHWAMDNGIDFIAHSFVRTKDDVLAVQKILDKRKSKIKIIAKIENRQGVENIDEILEHAYGIMVARGDLGVEVEMEELPGLQRMLIEKCLAREKPVIIATQMLHSMIEHPRPTRAEVTDVANAIYQRTDAIMLSGETAGGKYPIESVRTMSKIAIQIEKDLPPAKERVRHEVRSGRLASTLAKSAVQVSRELPIRAFITDSYSGRLPRYLSAFRSKIPVFSLCYHDNIVRELSLSYGLFCYPALPFKSNDEFSRYAIRLLRDQNCIDSEDIVAVIATSHNAQNATTYLEVGVAQDMINEINQEAYHKN